MPDLELYSVKYGCVQAKGGLNWGLSNGHVSPEDAYIAITAEFIRQNPSFFPQQGEEIMTRWDDGTQILCLLEGTQTINGQVYPKQISSSGDKSRLGSYIRRRLGVSSTHQITMQDLDNYGRNNVTITRLQNVVYEFDFSV